MGEAAFDAAVANAATFLRQRLRSGAYGLACIGNDGRPRFSDDKGHVFVASFFAEAMAGLMDEIDRTIVLIRILSEEIDGCWGFSPPGPRHMDQFKVFHVDSDDTAYVIRTLRRLGVNRPPDCLIKFHRPSERLFATFDAPVATSLTTEMTPANNLLAHPEVNANVFLALRDTHLDDLIVFDQLVEAQAEDGAWTSYFYPSRLYGTLLMLDLLHGNAAHAGAAERALGFVARSQNADGSWGAGSDPYETGLAVAALAGHDAHAQSMRGGVDYLLSSAADDGSWTSPSCIWAFPRPGDVWRAYDVHRTFITACCLKALRRADGRVSRHA